MPGEGFRSALAAELARIKRESFKPGVQVSDAQAFGVLMARAFAWDGADIADAAAYALEEANFHEESAQVRALMTVPL